MKKEDFGKFGFNEWRAFEMDPGHTQYNGSNSNTKYQTSMEGGYKTEKDRVGNRKNGSGKYFDPFSVAFP